MLSVAEGIDGGDVSRLADLLTDTDVPPVIFGGNRQQDAEGEDDETRKAEPNQGGVPSGWELG